jgi:hypothetical protein
VAAGQGHMSVGQDLEGSHLDHLVACRGGHRQFMTNPSADAVSRCVGLVIAR